METNPDEILPPDPVDTEEEAVPEATPAVDPRQGIPPSGIPQGVEYQSGEVPLGGNQPLP